MTSDSEHTKDDHRHSRSLNEVTPVASVKRVPSEDSLDLSQQIAETLKMPFDRVEVSSHGRNILSLYFDDIVCVLPEVGEQLFVEHGSINTLEAFVGPASERGHIFVDEHLDFWLFGLNFLTNFKACYHCSDEEVAQLSEWIRGHLNMLDNPTAIHLTLRDDLRPLLEDFTAILPATNALTVAMLVFILCHEISHYFLNHLEQAAAPQLELEADQRAYELFLRLASHRTELKYAQIDESVTSAPCLLMLYFRALVLFRDGKDVASDTHPPVTDRLNQLLALSPSVWSERSKEKFDVLGDQFRILANPWLKANI